MRKLTLAVALALAPVLAGCNATMFQQDIAAAEAKAVAIAQKIKAGIPVALADVKAALDAVCANGAAINSGTQQLQSTLLQLGNGPKTQANISATNKALGVLNGACNAAPAAGTVSDLVALFKQGLGAYLAAKNSATAATAAAANGT